MNKNYDFKSTLSLGQITTDLNINKTRTVCLCYLEILFYWSNRSRQQHLNYTGCNTRTVCLYNTNAYFLLMAAGGERNIVINLLQMSLLALYLRGTKISCLLHAIQEGGFYLPAYLYIYYLCLQYKLIHFNIINYRQRSDNF